MEEAFFTNATTGEKQVLKNKEDNHDYLKIIVDWLVNKELNQ